MVVLQTGIINVSRLAELTFRIDGRDSVSTYKPVKARFVSKWEQWIWSYCKPELLM
jgi:hypothetical protein